LFLLAATIQWAQAVSADPALRENAEKLLLSAEEIGEFVSEYRGMPFLEPVEKKVQSRKETEQFLVTRVEEEFTREEIEGAETLLKRLGLLPGDYNYYSSTVDVLTEQISGMYDYKDGFLALAEWIPLELQKPILVHEMTHALQDQHFGLENYLSPEVDNDDRAMALSALVEGDASLVMFAYTLMPEGRSVTDVPDFIELVSRQFAFMEATSPKLSSSPRYIKETIMFAYSYGAEFVKDIVAVKGWEGLNEIYRDPPATTEQIMHPEKFILSRDLPQDAEEAARKQFGDFTGQEPSPVSNVLGEFTLFLMLREHLDEKTARRGAEGWDGDYVALHRPGPGKDEILQMTLIWDSEFEAEEFLSVFDSYLLQRFGESAGKKRDTDISLKSIKQKNSIDIKNEGTMVYISINFPGRGLNPSA